MSTAGRRLREVDHNAFPTVQYVCDTLTVKQCMQREKNTFTGEFGAPRLILDLPLSWGPPAPLLLLPRENDPIPSLSSQLFPLTQHKPLLCSSPVSMAAGPGLAIKSTTSAALLGAN